MKRVYRGIVEGKIIRLRESIDIPKGTEAMVSLSFFEKETEKEILERELELLEKGFDMGKVLYVKREELYDH